MKKIYLILCTAVLLAGYRLEAIEVPEGTAMKNLTILWQRLVDESGKTCDRCGSTREELGDAVKSLRASLAPLGIAVTLQEQALSPKECTEDVSQSNRIWIADRPLEDWLKAKVGKSLCGFCCSELGDTVECRTMSVDGKTYEAIPSQLIVKAGLLAASAMVVAPGAGGCCPQPDSTEERRGACCPEPGHQKKKK